MAGPNQEALLKEYEVTAEYIKNYDDIAWRTTSVFVAAAMAGIPFVLRWDKYDPDGIICLLLLAVGVTLVIHQCKRYWRRCQEVEGAAWARMREIEAILGLRKVWYIHILDHWEGREKFKVYNDLSEAQKLELGKLRKNHRGPQGYKALRGLSVLVVVGYWLLFARLLCLGLVRLLCLGLGCEQIVILVLGLMQRLTNLFAS